MAGFTRPLGGVLGRPLGAKKQFTGTSDLVWSQVYGTSGFLDVPGNRKAIATILAWGAGGSGRPSGAGGGGAGALMKIVRVAPGQRITWTIGLGEVGPNGQDGKAGGDTTVTLPSGFVLRATGGAGGTSTAGGAGGVGIGGDINRKGGDGGSSSTQGAAGEFGGAGQAATNGGGGAAGFSDFGGPFIGAPGFAGDASTLPQGPGGGTSGAGYNTSGGTNGQVAIVINCPHY